MDKRAGDLSKEVKVLQEGLADYNTVLDKVRGRCGWIGHEARTPSRTNTRRTAPHEPQLRTPLLPPRPRPPARLTSRLTHAPPRPSRPALAHLPQVSSQAPVHVIQGEVATLRERNEQQRKRVDEVLTERLNLEDKAKKVGGFRFRFGCGLSVRRVALA
jgi:hypothetical protein